MCMCDPFGVGRGGEVSFCPQVPSGHPRLLLRASPPETKAKTSPLNKSHSVSYGYYFVHLLRRQKRKHLLSTSPIRSHTVTTSYISSGDKNKNLLFPVPYSLFPTPCSLLPAPCSLLPIDYRQLTIYSSCSASNSVCIGKLNTSRANCSATGKSPALYLAS